MLQQHADNLHLALYWIWKSFLHGFPCFFRGLYRVFVVSVNGFIE